MNILLQNVKKDNILIEACILQKRIWCKYSKCMLESDGCFCTTDMETDYSHFSPCI